MVWNLDGSGEREFAGTGPVVSLTNISAAGGGTSNDDYLFVVMTAHLPGTGGGRRISSVNISDSDNPGDGGNLQELFRFRMENDPATSQDVLQFWALRNADFSGGPIDVEAAPSLLRMDVTANHSNFADNHYAIYIMRSDSLPLTGDLVDYIEGGACQKADTETGNMELINEYIPLQFGVATRFYHTASSLTQCIPATFQVFDSEPAGGSFTRVSSTMTSVVDLGIGMAENQCFGKDNSADDSMLSIGALLFSENAIKKGPFLPFFDGDAVTASTCEPALFTPATSASIWAIGNISQGATTATSAELFVLSGGAVPYNFAFTWQGGTAPAGVTVEQSGVTDNIIELTVPSAAKLGDYSGTLIGSISDLTGQIEQFFLPVTFTVVP